MRFNNLVADNEKKKDYIMYGLMALVLGFVAYLILDTLATMIIIVVKILIQYWIYATIIIILIIFLLKRRRRKK